MTDESYAYDRAKELLLKVSTERGFLASANEISNYRRIWARDGVICGLAALLDGDDKLIATFKETLLTLAINQHALGNIPSNVHFTEAGTEVSFGGLAGRVDTVSWFIIGVCQYAYKTGDINLLEKLEPNIKLGFKLMQSWEYNDGDLMYVPRSGNWADEYPTQGFILYDQLLRLWALECYLYFKDDFALSEKSAVIRQKLENNYKKRKTEQTVYHPKAYSNLETRSYWAASLEPAGYQTQFDGFANSLALLLDLGDDNDTSQLINYTENLRGGLKLDLLPAFWPVIEEGDEEWRFLVNNCKYQFRNHPYEFHNGGTWQMVNGFYGLGLIKHGKIEQGNRVLQVINRLNEAKNWSFYENFNSKTGEPNGVPHCAWSAAASIMLKQGLAGNTLLI